MRAPTFLSLPPVTGTIPSTTSRDNEDKVDLSAFDLAGFDDLTLSSTSGGVTIDLTEHSGGTVLLQNINTAALDAADFIF